LADSFNFAAGTVLALGHRGGRRHAPAVLSQTLRLPSLRVTTPLRVKSGVLGACSSPLTFIGMVCARYPARRAVPGYGTSVRAVRRMHPARRCSRPGLGCVSLRTHILRRGIHQDSHANSHSASQLGLEAHAECAAGAATQEQLCNRYRPACCTSSARRKFCRSSSCSSLMLIFMVVCCNLKACGMSLMVEAACWLSW